jgi:hypothetical protein
MNEIIDIDDLVSFMSLGFDKKELHFVAVPLLIFFLFNP